LTRPPFPFDVVNHIDTKAPFPNDILLKQNYPNPFNPSTRIEYFLPKSDYATLKVYDLIGHEIITLVNKPHAAGWHSVFFDSHGLVDGVYFYRLQVGDVFAETKKLVVTK